MKKRTFILLFLTHIAVGALGFAIGIYALPILIAPSAPSTTEIDQMAGQQVYTTKFDKDRLGSDFLHWGEGAVSIGKNYVSLLGKLAPGPDYQLYFSPEFVENEEQFERLKHTMKRVGNVKTFDNFVVEISPNINLDDFNTVVIWCESFGEFITSAKYR